MFSALLGTNEKMHQDVWQMKWCKLNIKEFSEEKLKGKILKWWLKQCESSTYPSLESPGDELPDMQLEGILIMITDVKNLPIVGGTTP